LERLIYEPNPDSPANIGLTDLFKTNKVKYEEVLKTQAETLKKCNP